MAEHRSLKSELMGSGSGVFAVLDGAQFDNLPDMLSEAELFARPLYLDRGNAGPDQLRTAPQLVWLDRRRSSRNCNDISMAYPVDERVLDNVFDLTGERHALVWWQCRDGGDRLYRHLRGINMVFYPDAAYLDDPDPLPEHGYDLVVFRHADGNAMAQFAPALDWTGRSRLLGPAEWLLFSADDDWSDGPLFIAREAGMPAAPPGPMRIGRREIRQMEDLRLDWLTRRSADYIREYAPEHVRAMDDEALKHNTLRWLREAQAFGVTEEPAYRKWCYLQAASSGQLHAIAAVRDTLHAPRPSATADEKVHTMMRKTIEALEVRGHG